MVMETSELWEDQRCGPQPLSYSLLSPEPWPPHWPDVHLVGQCISFWTQARVISGLWPQAVNWASLSAEDEVDMVNDGQDSEEKISLPSCYGGIGRQGESRGLKGVWVPLAWIPGRASVNNGSYSSCRLCLDDAPTFS